VGAPGWTTPNPPHSCCASPAIRCWCGMRAQPGPAACSSHGAARPTCGGGDGPAARDPAELGRAAKRQQQPSGWLAAAALPCRLQCGSSLCPLSSRSRTPAPSQDAKQERGCSRGAWGVKQMGGAGAGFTAGGKRNMAGLPGRRGQPPDAGCPKGFDAYSHPSPT